jgi:predicted HicB family RNase H-like nuclease
MVEHSIEEAQEAKGSDISSLDNAKFDEVLRVARGLFEAEPDWATFYREVFGKDGVVRRATANEGQLAAFKESLQYETIHQMLAQLRQVNSTSLDGDEPTRVITIRLPKSVHESIRSEAFDRRTSMNKLCISKLVQLIDAKFVPVEPS